MSRILRRRTLLLGLACTLIASSSSATPTELETLFARFRKSPGLYAKFVEEKHIDLLAEPLKNEGTIHYSPTSGLARHCRKPSVSSLLLTANSVQVWDGKKVDVLPLAKGALRTFVDAFRMLLSGDRAGVEAHFRVSLDGTADGAWTVRLTPLDEGVAKMVTKIALSGNGGNLRELRLDEASGDYGVTTFSEVDFARRYTQADEESVFHLPPRLP